MVSLKVLNSGYMDICRYVGVARKKFVACSYTFKVQRLDKQHKYCKDGISKRSMPENYAQSPQNIIVNKVTSDRLWHYSMQQHLYFHNYGKYEEDDYSKWAVISE